MSRRVLLLLVLLVSFVSLEARQKDVVDTYHVSFKKGNYFDTDLAWKVLKESFLNIGGDLYNIAATPLRYPLATAGYLGLVGGLVAVDKPVTTFYHQHIEKSLDLYKLPKILFTQSYISAEESWIGAGILVQYLAGFALGDEKSQATALMATKAVLYSLGITHFALKSITGRNRPQPDLIHCDDTNPYRTCDPYDFKPFQSPKFTGSNRTSMPSYHLTLYFSLAKVYQEMYNNYVIPYSVLALLFMSNIKGHHHWVSDMVGGAIVGTLIGDQIVRNYKKDKMQQAGLRIIPVRNGIGFHYTF